MLTVKEVMELLKISSSRIVWLCAEGRMPGAIKNGNRWQIPIEAPQEYQKSKEKLKTRPEGMVNCNEAAQILGVGATVVSKYLRQQRIPEAKKVRGRGNCWQIPIDALMKFKKRREVACTLGPKVPRR